MRALLQDRKRILVGPVVDTEHDHRTHVRPQPARVGAAFGASGQPVHVAMRAGVEEIVEMFSGLRQHIRTGDTDAIESQRARFAGERGLQNRGGELDGCVQKSRST